MIKLIADRIFSISRRTENSLIILSMQTLPVKILGTGIHLPRKRVTAGEIDRRAGLPEGWVEKHAGVLTRHFVSGETASGMGADAAKNALADAKLTLAQIDCIVCTSGTPEQMIPSTAALVQEQLGEDAAGLPCFDINATCLSFLVGLDLLSNLIPTGRYQRVLRRPRRWLRPA